MNQKSIELEKTKVNFNHLWKIKEIDVDIVTFAKYDIGKSGSIGNTNNSTINLTDLIGTETHKVTPDVQLELSGKVGEIIKGFESGKNGNSVKVKNIIYLEK